MANTALKLYRELLRSARDMRPYNMREYSLRLVRDRFREGRLVRDAKQVDELLVEARINADLLRRQVTLARLYVHDTLVIEQPSSNSAARGGSGGGSGSGGAGR